MSDAAAGGVRHGVPHPCARVLVEVEPHHLDHPFDYAVPAGLDPPVQVGSRVLVGFAGRRVRGLVVDLVDEPEVEPGQLRPVTRVLGPHAWVSPTELDLLRWAGERYAAPVAHAVRHALPDRVVAAERAAAERGWFPPGSAPRPAAPEPARDPVDPAAWEPYGAAGAALRDAVAGGTGAWYWRPLPGEDVAARVAELAASTLAAGRDVLLLTPSPQSAVADAVAALGDELAVDVRGDAGSRRLYTAWLEARCGQARVVVGERRVAFWPLERLGLAVLLDEANPALKERRSPHHHAREVLLERARRSRAVALLVGHVPSATAWRLLAERRVRPAVAVRGTERRLAPTVLVDDRSREVRTRLGTTAVRALREAVGAGRLAVVLAARRGEGRALACTACGLRLACSTCDASVARAEDGRVHCEGCGWRSAGAPACSRCGGSRFVPLAAGAARLGTELRRMLPDTAVTVLEGYGQPYPPAPAVVVTTRGSVLADPPGPVGAVVLPDVDGQLRRPGLDAAEDALRLSMTAASWTAANWTAADATPADAAAVHGRADRAGAHAGGRIGGHAGGTVVVQTREPRHHAVQALVRWDPGGFWRAESALRGELRFPPAAFAVRLDCAGDGVRVADDLRAHLPDGDEVLGPLPQQGRAHLLVKCDDRVATVTALRARRSAWSREGLDVRVDVDPVDVL